MRKNIKTLLITFPLILLLIGYLFSEEDKAKREEAKVLIQKIEEFPYSEEAKKNPEKFYELFNELIKIGKPALPVIEEAMKRTKNQELKAMLLEASAEIAKKSPDPKLTKQLIERLKNKKGNPGIRADTAVALGNLGGPGVYEALVTILSDENELVKSMAALALGLLGDKRAVEPLIAMLGDSSSVVVCRAMTSLGKLKDTRATEPLISLLSSTNKDIQLGAIISLGELGDRKATEPLISVAKDRENQKRIHAITSLGKIGGNEAFNTLIELLQDKSGYIVWGVAKILATIGDQKAAEPLAIAIRKAASYDKEDLKKAYKDLTGQEYQE